MGDKRLELLRHTVPGVALVTMLWNPALVERTFDFEETAAAAQTNEILLQVTGVIQ